MVEWFLTNYEDPVNSTPYDGGEGGISINAAGRCSAREELMRRFYAGLETRFSVDDLEETKIASKPDAC